jgi:hypothetical protein
MKVWNDSHVVCKLYSKKVHYCTRESFITHKASQDALTLKRPIICNTAPNYPSCCACMSFHSRKRVSFDVRHNSCYSAYCVQFVCRFRLLTAAVVRERRHNSMTLNPTSVLRWEVETDMALFGENELRISRNLGSLCQPLQLYLGTCRYNNEPGPGSVMWTSFNADACLPIWNTWAPFNEQIAYEV